MKLRSPLPAFVCALVLLLPRWALAAGVTPSPLTPAETTSWSAVKRSASQTHWQSLTIQTNRASGRLVVRTNSFIEIGGGINVASGTNFIPADTSFVITADGAEALGTIHKVSVPADIWLGNGIKVTQRDGQQVVFQPLGIDYYDPVDGRSVLLDAVTNSVGWLVNSNEIVFSNCLTTIKASIRIRNFPWGA